MGKKDKYDFKDIRDYLKSSNEDKLSDRILEIFSPLLAVAIIASSATTAISVIGGAVAFLNPYAQISVLEGAKVASPFGLILGSLLGLSSLYRSQEKKVANEDRASSKSSRRNNILGLGDIH